MRKICYILVVFTLLFATACDYKLVETDSLYSKLVFPNGTEYYWTDMSYFCIDPNPLYKDGNNCEIVEKIVVDGYKEYYICNRKNFPEEIVTLEMDTVTMQDYPYMFVKDGYSMPTFESTDEIEAIYAMSFDEYMDWYYDDYYSSSYLDGRAIHADYKDFMEYMIECRSDNTLVEIKNLGDYECVAVLVFEFASIDDFYFMCQVFKCAGIMDSYYIDAINNYEVPRQYLDAILPVK